MVTTDRRPSSTRATASPEATATDWADARRELAAAELSWLSTVRPDGRPHVTPLLTVWRDGALHFCTGARERKARNLAGEPAGRADHRAQRAEGRAGPGRRGHRGAGAGPGAAAGAGRGLGGEVRQRLALRGAPTAAFDEPGRHRARSSGSSRRPPSGSARTRTARPAGASTAPSVPARRSSARRGAVAEPTRVTEIAAARFAVSSASSTGRPRASSASSTPVCVSPAPGGVDRPHPRRRHGDHPVAELAAGGQAAVRPLADHQRPRPAAAPSRVAAPRGQQGRPGGVRGGAEQPGLPLVQGEHRDRGQHAGQPVGRDVQHQRPGIERHPHPLGQAADPRRPAPGRCPGRAGRSRRPRRCPRRRTGTRGEVVGGQRRLHPGHGDEGALAVRLDQGQAEAGVPAGPLRAGHRRCPRRPARPGPGRRGARCRAARRSCTAPPAGPPRRPG